jgi:hypothetical protein
VEFCTFDFAIFQKVANSQEDSDFAEKITRCPPSMHMNNAPMSRCAIISFYEKLTAADINADADTEVVLASHAQQSTPSP